MAFSNSFMVEFQGLPKEVFDIDPELSDNIKYFCDEAQLPNVNTDTGSIRGMYPGLGIVDYAHTKVYTDLQLGFMCDANMTILKMLNAWHDYMFIDGEPGANGSKQENRHTRMRYRNQYACNIVITKTELSPNTFDERKSVKYVIEKAYPFAIDSVPLQFGQAQVAKVTAQFKYQRHYTINNNLKGIRNSNTIDETKDQALLDAQQATGLADLANANANIGSKIDFSVP